MFPPANRLKAIIYETLRQYKKKLEKAQKDKNFLEIFVHFPISPFTLRAGLCLCHRKFLKKRGKIPLPPKHVRGQKQKTPGGSAPGRPDHTGHLRKAGQ
jgi:hypothetical protein